MASAILALKTIEQVMTEGNDIIRKLVQEKKASKVIPFHCNLAPCYGKLKEGGSIKMLDENLKIMIAATQRVLAKMTSEAKDGDDVSWDNVLAAMTNNPLLEAMDNALITRSDKLIKDEVNVFKIDGSPDHSIVREVETWFVKLIEDPDVLADTKIDINTLGNIVAQTGATVTDLATAFWKKQFEEQKIVDIGVLRYPDIDHPYFKLYRIQLTAWSDCTRTVFVQHDTNGITGTYNAQKFRPRASVIAGLSPQTKEKAIKEAEDIFAD